MQYDDEAPHTSDHPDQRHLHAARLLLYGDDHPIQFVEDILLTENREQIISIHSKLTRK